MENIDTDVGVQKIDNEPFKHRLFIVYLLNLFINYVFGQCVNHEICCVLIFETGMILPLVG